MARFRGNPPSYRYHKPTGQAVVRLNGVDHYLGRHGTPKSREKYDRLIAEWLMTGRQPSPSPRSTPIASPPASPPLVQSAASRMSIDELTSLYWEHAQEYYVKRGRPTSEQESIKLALRPLTDLYGHVPITEFGPLALEVVRKAMVDAGVTRHRINQQVGRIRRMFEWGVSKEIVPVAVPQALRCVKGLRAGRTNARESVPVRPVADEIVERTLPHLSRQLQGMIRFQRLVGCRPAEVTLLRPCDVNQEGDVWVYTPESHKTEHHGRGRRIFIGPKAQEMLRPWLDRDPQSYCFSPKEARDEFDAKRKRERVTPMRPSDRRRRRKRKPKKSPGERYTTPSYGQAIRLACKRNNIPSWSPNQLRHTRATEVRRRYGLEGSQVVLGHADANVTQIYAERDFNLAAQIMREIG